MNERGREGKKGVRERLRERVCLCWGEIEIERDRVIKASIHHTATHHLTININLDVCMNLYAAYAYL